MTETGEVKPNTSPSPEGGVAESTKPVSDDRGSKKTLKELLEQGPPSDGDVPESSRTSYNTSVLPKWFASLGEAQSEETKFKNGRTKLALNYGGELRLNCRYNGQMIDGKVYGRGTAEIGSECTQSCETWIDGKLNGIVVETWADRDVVVREYINGRMHGKATIFWKELKPTNAIYKNGRMIIR